MICSLSDGTHLDSIHSVEAHQQTSAAQYRHRLASNLILSKTPPCALGELFIATLSGGFQGNEK
ncbi:hypothetical protein Mapa_011160 [Marchantia paleacea]|nr:hypothetical protein Mapa_011160 [Marchantia paleacea]